MRTAIVLVLLMASLAWLIENVVELVVGWLLSEEPRDTF